jgi:starch-binding outer membrane protein, SusD/RagB family
MKKINRYLFFTALLTVGLAGCKKDLLDVPNGNDPDFLKVYAKGEDVENVAAGLFNAVFHGEHDFTGVQMMMAVAADHATCSWGNAGMRDMSWEPRNNGWNNSPSYGNGPVLKATYDKMYSAISTASKVIKAIDNGVDIGDNGAGNARAIAAARFVQGWAYGNLALLFDKAHVVDEATSVEGVLETAITYKQVATAALGYLDKAITEANSTFTIPASWFGTPGDISSADFKKMCNTAAARILAYLPRNKTELAAVDWAKVKTYADNGITADWNIVMDGTSTWYFEAGDYLTYPGWGRTDMYVVNLMDPTQPKHWDDSPTFPHPPASTNPVDQRLNTDFQFLASNDFLAARGYYHFSNYRNKRYDAIYVAAIGEKAEVMKAENDLLKAEARAYTGDLAGAAAIINAGTRVTRGGMAPVAAVLADIVKAIHHERHVELYTTGMGIQFFEMRKLNLLQKGTPLHFPIPAKILELFRLSPPFYTFGTEAKADGIGTSNAGWR